MDTGAPNVIYINHGRQISNLELFTTLRTKASLVIFTRPFISDDKVHPISGISSITADTWKAGPLMWKVMRMIMPQIICLPAPYPHRKLLLARDFPG